ncbi:MAG TPA: hypothetical protein VJS12_05360 [Steroidobacteraceae bacterium]|nr:hypothetical protein [Steroidobacteraceae bacterium]
MSWIPTSQRSGSRASQAKEAVLANVHQGLLLATASRRLQDPISSRRASIEARHLLSVAKQLCEEMPDADGSDERVRVAIASLTRALEDE